MDKLKSVCSNFEGKLSASKATALVEKKIRKQNVTGECWLSLQQREWEVFSFFGGSLVPALITTVYVERM